MVGNKTVRMGKIPSIDIVKIVAQPIYSYIMVYC